jgi:hypothetical protein
MVINKFHYKQLSEPKKIYIDATTLEIRERLNVAFKKPSVEEDMTGIFGKYYKLDKMYKVKYIYARNKQLQPMTYDRYHYLLDVGEDENGSFIEYAMVYDKLYDPVIRFVYMLAVLAVFVYLFYRYNNDTMSMFSALTLGGIVLASLALVFKKSKESKEICEKAEKMFKNLISDIEFS